MTHPETRAPALRLTGVRYQYPATTRRALDGVDLEVRAGEVLGLVGPNDAGKTTVCLVAAGLAPQSIGGRLEGRVELGGQATIDLRPHQLAQRAGSLFQNPATQLSGTVSTVWEEVAFGPRNLGLTIDEIVERVEWALGLLGLAGLGQRDPTRLSGGQAQLVALASILVLRPACLILDEPTSQLDPAGTRLVGAALADLAGAGATAILIAEHKTDLLARLAQRVAVLDGGRVVAVGSSADVLADDRLAAWGVEAPSAVRIRRRLADAGMALDPPLTAAFDDLEPVA
ncbi:MAG: ABC transporter ATP-binding protein [Chloroflexota bacterium]